MSVVSVAPFCYNHRMNVWSPSSSEDLLIAELQAWGLHYLIGALPASAAPGLSADMLLAELARQKDARVRSALIPLLLQNPDLASAVPKALSHLNPYDQWTLKVYYTAAVILQDEFAPASPSAESRQRLLPDYFSSELGIEVTASCEERLHQLGEFHAQHADLRANWPETYRHAAQIWMRHLREGEDGRHSC
ncbi:hypothetical protein D6833_08530 [Candidatus Parcubacteria bacterium]|nr:MAG: hypothetical protein D6833_08530 [Candidatus Parcubacteria bacterium]